MNTEQIRAEFLVYEHQVLNDMDIGNHSDKIYRHNGEFVNRPLQLRFEVWRAAAEKYGKEASPTLSTPGEWLIDGSLIYRLNDSGNNCDEINVTMADGSRAKEERAKKANEVLDSLAFAESMHARKWQTPLGKTLEPRADGLFKKTPLGEIAAHFGLTVHEKDTE